MVSVVRGVAAGAALLVVTLAVLGATVGLTPLGWVAGLPCGAVTGAVVSRSRAVALGPADLVTLARLALACGVAALAADSFATPATTRWPLLALTAVALALDAVDGRVARRTGTASEFGGRFDGEADAFLLLVVSGYVAATVSPWAVAIGAARYLFWLAGRGWPWLRGELPPRYWRKVVTAVQGIALLVAVADVTPRPVTGAVLLIAIGLLAESFGRDVLWLWRHRRAAYDLALDRARRAAYPPGEFVGQESFMRATEILDLADRAGAGPGVTVLDLCCGVAGPGRYVTAELGCDYLGVDADPGAVAVARERAAGLPCRFEVRRVPPLPEGRFDVVLLLETMLAFPDKEPLLRAVAASLSPGGRFGFTVEEGPRLSPAEARLMPAADTVWPVPLDELRSALRRVGLRVLSVEDCSESHRQVADALVDAFTADRAAIRSRIGRRALADLLASHRLWSDWLGSGRVRKLACIADKAAPEAEPAAPSVRSATWEPVAGSAAGASSDRSER